MVNIRVPFVNLAAAYKNDAHAISKAIDEIGNSGQYILGPNVKNFEEEFAAFIGYPSGRNETTGHNFRFTVIHGGSR